MFPYCLKNTDPFCNKREYIEKNNRKQINKKEKITKPVKKVKQNREAARRVHLGRCPGAGIKGENKQ